MMQRVCGLCLLIVGVSLNGQTVKPLPNGMDAPEGWKPGAPRDEIRPQFGYEPDGGPGGRPALIISSETAGGNGYWRKTFTLAPGQFYRFSAFFKADDVATPPR